MQPSEKKLAVLFAVGTVAATVVGWKLFWFITDDAYIAFRYVSNSLDGHGLTWNAPPFRPVEGYSSFLWVMVLREVWQVFGVEPPRAANPVSLLFGLGTLALGARMVWRVKLPESLAPHRLALLSLVMLGTVTNRTFLTWLSSGLETSLFNFLFTWWLLEGTTAPEGRTRRTPHRLAVAATLSALARPDGMLLVLATPFMVLGFGAASIRALEASGERLRQAARSLLPLWPLLGIPAQLLWRKATYGEWLPNTYYAKHVDSWPASGARYLASFVVEYGVYVWLVLLVAVVVLRFRPWLGRLRELRGWLFGGGPDGVLRALEVTPAVFALGALGTHIAYYTFIIGGDHFEYRVYSHLVLLAFVSAVPLLGSLARSRPADAPLRPRWAVGVLALLILCSYPIPWTHWAKTRNLETRGETFRLVQPLAPSFPLPLRPLVKPWDDWQAWLISHSVCMRHQEHKVFRSSMEAWLPARDELNLTEDLAGQGPPVMEFPLVGIVGWVFKDVAVIDTLGLNDYVIARNAELRPAGDEHSPEGRQMAHDRMPPAGYVECFRPNVALDEELNVVGLDRSEPLTAEQIRDCETRDW